MKKLLDLKEFISITPNRITRYVRNVAPDMTDYREKLLSEGGTINEDGSITPFKSQYFSTNNKHCGIISDKANKKIMTIIDYLVLLSKNKTIRNEQWNTTYKWKINFITLTLPSPQVHSDKQINTDILQPFINWLRQSKQVTKYFWRAETQSNGNIHYHLCTNVFIPWLELKVTWNKYCNKLGYVDKFAEKWNHRTPNSTDIHSLKNVKNISKYLSKYCGKNSHGVVIMLGKSFDSAVVGYPYKMINYSWKYPKKNTKFFRPVHGRLWACSENLSKLVSCQVHVDSLIDNDIRKIVSNPRIKQIKGDYFTTFLISAKEYLSNELFNIRNALYSHIDSVFFPVPS